MSTYNMTPAERRARAQAQRASRENRKLQKEYQMQQETLERISANEKVKQQEKEGKNIFTRSISTIGDIASNVITGAAKGLEGIYDLGASLIGGIGGAFDKDFQNSVKSHVANDWVGKNIGDPLQELNKYSYTKDGGIVEGVLSGIGQMLPAVAVSIATAGIGAAASGASLAASMGSTAAQAASLATLGISAAGNSTEEAFNDGADYYKGLGYGIASGAVEVATEKMSGGFGKLTGKGVLDNVLPSVGKKGVGKFLKEAAGEGLEEVVSEAVNPLTKAIYKGKVENFMTEEHVKDMAKAGLIGGLTSMAYGETVGRVLHTTGKEGDIKDALAEYSTLKTKTQNLDRTGKIDDITKNGKSNRQNIFDNQVENLKTIEQTLKNVNEGKRAKIIERNNLEGKFEADGTIKADFAINEGLSGIVGQTNGQEQSLAEKALASQPVRYRTAFSNDKVTAKALEKVGANPFVGEMTSEQSAVYSDFRKAIGALSQKSNGSIKYVVADSFNANACIDSESGTIVIGADQFENGASGTEMAKAFISSDMWQKSMIHETTHATEGLSKGSEFERHIKSNDAEYENAIESFVARGYFGDDNAVAIKKYVALENKLKQGAALTEKEMENKKLLASESTAIIAENVLGTESFINKLIRNDINIAQRIMNKIADGKEAFASLQSKDARAAYKYLTTAENLYIKAIEETGGKYIKGKIVGINDKDDKEKVAKESKKEYNRLINNTFPTYKEGKGTQANEVSTRWAHRADIELGDRTTISFNDKWYLIEKFDDSDLGYQIVDSLTEKQYKEYTEERSNGIGKRQSIQEGVSRLTSIHRRGNSSNGRLIFDDSISSGNRGGNNEIRGLDKVQSQRRETSSNRGGDSESGSQGKQKLKYSLKDNQGNNLTQAQVDFFKDSKVRDNDGNLQVVYHGTNKEFFTFDINKRGDNTGLLLEGVGFYFTENEDIANSYSRGTNKNRKVYLNITKPMLVNQNKFTKNIRKKIFLELHKIDNYVLSNYADVDYEGVNAAVDDALKIESSNETDLDFIASLVNSGVTNPQTILNTVTKVTGYDGVINNEIATITKKSYKVFVAFDSDQIKLTSNQNPTESVDIRYSKKEEKSYYKLSEGQLKKLIANNTKYKTYTLADSETIINNVLSNFMAFGAKYGDLSGKTKKQVVDMLWKGLNSADPGYRTKTALNISDYIVQNGVLENIYGDADSAWAVDTIYVLKPYLHSLDLSGISEEIKHRYDTDKSPYLLWGKRRGARGIAPDQLGQLLEDNGIQIDAINEADIFIQVNDLYKSAVSELKKKSKTFLAEGLSSEELKKLRQEIASEVLKGFDYAGGDSKLANIVNKYTDRIRVLKEQLQDEKVRNSVINKLLEKLQKLKDIKLGTFLNATEFKNDIFKGSIEKLAAIKFRGDLNQSGTRDILKGLSEWYVKSNNIVGEAYEQEIGDALNDIANGKGKLTTQELLNLTNIVDYFKHFVETYNKVLRNGKLVEAQPIAEKYIKTINDNKAINVGWFKKQNGPAYVKIFGDPMSVARRMDMYESGFYTEMLTRLRESTVNAEIDEMNIRTELDEFLSKNKKYLKQASKRTVIYLGKDIPFMQALYVYMALGRKQAQLGLEKSGFTFTHNKETIRINGFNTEGKTFASAQNEIFGQLNEKDKHFIEIAKKIFNEECKERKSKTDIDRKGYSNVSEDEYIPIRRANIEKNVDASLFKEEMDRVSNASFNKDTVQGAAQELIVEPLNTVLDRHIHAVAQYANLSAVIDEYNTFFTLDISGDKNHPVSVATASQNTWKDGNEYFQKLISDIQGIPTSKGVGNRAMSFVRGNYAKYQLGCNPKVWLTQLSSFAAAGSILDVKSIIRGLRVASNDIDEYSQLAKLRNKENTAAMAQGVLSKPNGKVNLTRLNDFGDVLMKPIGMVDRFVVKRLFGACQVQVEKENDLKLGSVENKQKAAELLNKVILETQQNSMATERSAAMRSGSEIMKTITMFSADAMKVVGRVIDSAGEVVTLRARRKIETDPIKITELDKRINVALKKTAKSVASLVTSAVLMALIAQLFRTLYNKDDEDDNISQNMAIDAIGNLLGGLPIIRDIYSRFTQGYEIDGYAYTMLNDLLDSGVGIFETVGDIFSGKANSKDIALNIKKLTYAGGQFLGLPTRNVYNIVYGLTKRISPSSAYKINDAFYNQSYSADLAKAIANNDDSMIATISGIMLGENVGEIEDALVRKEMNTLVSMGHSVLPKSIGDKIIYNNEEIALTNRQREQFKTIYSEANSKVASLVNLSQYDSASDEVRAKAIKYIYDIYYNLALEDLLGVELENKNFLFSEAIDIEKLAIIVASARELVADTGKNGKTVAGTKKAKVQAYVNSLQLSAAQKYMIMGYLGYTNAKGKNLVKSYIQRLSLSKARKQQLFEYSGYAA